MNAMAFKQSLGQDRPPPGLSALLLALWYDGKGDWNRAHQIAQDLHDRDGAWVHAYLHRKEGDPSNAAYWYRQAGRPVAGGSLEDEWDQLVEELSTHPLNPPQT
ncbi:MAG TPA: hypothetical protein VFG50_10280 [Rhodothermales bacterium]|nr:hypothetical protein [Rhodothermales bacterium]